MFIDFGKVFSKQDFKKMPDTLKAYYDQKIPKDFEYREIDGKYYLVAKKGEGSISGFTYKPSEEDKAILGSNFDARMVLDYHYNAQKPIHLLLKEKGKVTINGQPIEISKIVVDPFNVSEGYADEILLYPPKFQSFSISLGDEENKTTKIITIERQKNNSLDILSFKSVGNEAFSLQYEMNITNNKFSMKAHLDLTRAKSIRDKVDSLRLYMACKKGKFYLNGALIDDSTAQIDFMEISEKYFEFWAKVLFLEESLNVQFDPTINDIPYETICLVETLFQNLKNKKPIREHKKITSVNATWELKDGTNCEHLVGETLTFMFNGTSSYELFNASFQLKIYTAIFQSRVTACENAEGKITKIFLEDASEETPMIVADLCFVSQEEMFAFDAPNNVESFYKAQYVEDYLT